MSTPDRLREIFNRHKWHTGHLAVLTVFIRHRGAPGDERRLLGADIHEIGPRGLVVDAVDAEGEPVAEGRAFIPWHRVLRVVGPEGTLWERHGAAIVEDA